MTAAPFLEFLRTATLRADAEETKLRREFSERLKGIEQDRAFAYRRYNLMRLLAEAMSGAESEEIAVGNAIAALRARLGWHGDSEAHDAVLSRFAPVGQALFADLAPPEAEADEVDVTAALKEFEVWYAERHGSPFWILFENYIPETPVVDF